MSSTDKHGGGGGGGGDKSSFEKLSRSRDRLVRVSAYSFVKDWVRVPVRFIRGLGFRIVIQGQLENVFKKSHDSRAVYM